MTSEPAIVPLDLQDRLRFEALLADLSSKFVNLPPADVDHEIEDALRRLCELVEIDFAALWQFSTADPELITPTHIYARPDVVLPSEPMRKEHYPWSVQQVLAGREYAISSLADLPAEAAVDRETLRQIGVQSGVCLPLAVGGEPAIGALGLNVLRKERDWPDDLLKRLQLVAQVFANALARRRHELRLQESETRLAAGSDLAGLAFYEVDFGDRTIFVDDRFRDLAGVPPEREVGLGPLAFFIEILHPGDRERFMEERRRLHDGAIDRAKIEYRILHPTRGERWVQHVAGVAQRDDGRRAVRTFGVLRDITERKLAEDELRDLSRRLIGAHEEERALLARELHDDLTQRVAVLAIEAGRAELGTSDGSLAESMRSIRDELVRLSEDIHSLAYQLHPSVLDDLGLAEALRAECERQGRRSRIELSVELDPLPAVIGKEPALCLFRIAQEALNNIGRHAGAGAASVALRQVDDGLFLAVRDDGVGFDPASPGGGRSLGLASMRERVQLVNGTLDIESAPGQGTTIVAWVPVEGSSG